MIQPVCPDASARHCGEVRNERVEVLYGRNSNKRSVAYSWEPETQNTKTLCQYLIGMQPGRSTLDNETPLYHLTATGDGGGGKSLW